MKTRKAKLEEAKEVAEPARAKFPNVYSAGILVKCSKWARENPNGLITITGGYFDEVMCVDGWRRWFRDCLDRKIAAKDQRAIRNGRHTGPDYDLAMIRLRPYVGNRIIIDYIDPIVGRRVWNAMRHRLRVDRDHPTDAIRRTNRERESK